MACQVTTPQTARLPLKMTQLPSGPMAKVSSDFLVSYQQQNIYYW